LELSARILHAAQLIQKFVHGISRVEFDGNDLVRSAVTWQIVIIGEVAKRLSAEASGARSNTVAESGRNA